MRRGRPLKVRKVPSPIWEFMKDIWAEEISRSLLEPNPLYTYFVNYDP